jgi:hypothetical protein
MWTLTHSQLGCLSSCKMAWLKSDICFQTQYYPCIQCQWTFLSELSISYHKTVDKQYHKSQVICLLSYSIITGGTSSTTNLSESSTKPLNNTGTNRNWINQLVDCLEQRNINSKFCKNKKAWSSWSNSLTLFTSHCKTYFNLWAELCHLRSHLTSLDCQFICWRQTQHLKTVLFVCYHDVCLRWRISCVGLASHILWQKDSNLTTSYWHNELRRCIKKFVD